LQWPNTPKRKCKRNRERIPFVIACTAWKALFQGGKKNRLCKTRKKEMQKDTADKYSIEERKPERKKCKRTQQI